MTQEEKQLLLMDLCSRLPYGLMFQSYHSECGIEGKGTFDFKVGDDATLSILRHWCESDNNKPYLRPMFSMTEEELKELNEKYENIAYFFIQKPPYYHGLQAQHEDIGSIEISEFSKIYDWLNAHHFDYRGLIEKGLALKAKEGMYKTE